MSFPDPITPAPRATSEASLNLPAARALAEEAKQWHDSAYPEKAPVEKLIATLFALCDEVERERAEHAAQLAALRGRCIEVTELVPACWPSGDGYSTTEQDVANDVAALIAERIEGLAIPDPTAALARVRAEAVREAIGRIDADLLAHAYAASDDTMDTAEGVEMFQKVLLNTLTPPAGEG